MNTLLKKILEKAKTKKQKEKEARNRSLLAGVLLLMIGTAMAAGAAFLLWTHVFATPDIEKILPEKDLVGFVQIETFDPLQMSEAPVDWFEYLPIVPLRESIHPFSEADVFRWRGSRGGIAMYQSPQDEYEEYAHFLEFSQRTEALAYLESLDANKSQFGSYAVYFVLFPRAQYCTLFSGYLTCATDETLLHTILDAKNSEAKMLSQTTEFQNIAAQLPRRHAMRFFARSKAMARILSVSIVDRSLDPLTNVISEIGGTLIKKSGADSLQYELVLMRKTTGGEPDILNETITFSDDAPELLSSLTSDTNGFIWGTDITEDFLRGFEYFSQIDPAFELTIRNMLRERVHQTFGGQISWELDILPLLEGEFVIATDPDASFIIIDTDDPEFANAKLTKIIRGLETMSAQFTPEIISKTLEDGTIIREVFPNQDAVTTEQTEVKNGTVFSITARDGDGNIALEFSAGQKDDLLIIATSAQKALELISAQNTPEIMQKFPLRFAGPSEEVFSVTPEFFARWIAEDQEKPLPNFERLSGKIVNTPLFLRLQAEVEL